jgi:hypothetical protein
MTLVPPASRGASWLLRGLAATAVLGMVVLGVAIEQRRDRWHATLDDVRFVDHPEKVSAGAAAVTVQGYVIATVRSDVDFFRLARADMAPPKVEAALCDSDKAVGAWFDPLPFDTRAGETPYRYAILIPMRSRDADLSLKPESVCVRFHVETGGPLGWVRSRPVVVTIGAALHEQLAAYAGRDGPIDLVLDAGCAPYLCEPRFSARDLERRGEGRHVTD